MSDKSPISDVRLTADPVTVVRTGIDVTPRSHSMQQLLCTVTKCAMNGRGVRMIVPQGDALELGSFCNEIAVNCATSGLHTVLPDDKTIFWTKTGDRREDMMRCAKSERAILIVEAERLNSAMIDELIRMHKEVRRKRPIIAAFRGFRGYLKSLREWPEATQPIFSPHPYHWPALHMRRADVSGIVDQICKTLRLPDGKKQAVLSDGALDEIRREPGTSVEDLCELVTSAFRITVRHGETAITAQDVKEAKRNDTIRHRTFATSMVETA